MLNETSTVVAAEPKLSLPILVVVLPCFNEADSLPHTIAQLSVLLDRMVDDKEVSRQSYLFFVDDGSTDKTWDVLTKENRDSGRIKGLRLSRNFGHQPALLAGLSEVCDDNDIVISIDADLQQDPEAMREFVRRYKEGADIVFGVREHRGADSFLKRKTAGWFYALMKLMGVNIIPDHADYRLLNKKALHALLLYPEPHLFLRGLCTMLGFQTSTVEFKVHPRMLGETKYSFSKMVKLAVYGITSLSIVPLRIVSACGLLIFVASGVMGVYVVWHSLVVGDTIPGWASTTLPIYFLGGVQLLSLGVIGEYIGKIYSTVQNRPRWISRDRLGDGGS